MKKKISVLIFIDWFLPGTASGGPVRSITNMIDHMAEVANFKVITRDVDYMSSEPYKNITYNKWNLLKSNLEVYYLSKAETGLGRMKSLIKSVDYDVAYINGIYSFYFSIIPLLLLRKSSKLVIVGARGMLNAQAFTVKPLRKLWFIRISNALGLYKQIIFHATNEEEKTEVKRRIGTQAKVKVAPNFPRRLTIEFPSKRKKLEGTVDFINVARIAKEKGTLKLIKFLSELNDGIVNLDIFGPIYDHEYWKQCLVEIEKLPKNICVSYRGVLASEKIPETLDNYHFFVMPSEGENFGHSILEGLSKGLPVLISNRTPWKNLEENQAGWDIPLKEVNQFVEALNKCIKMNQEEYDKWSNSAFTLAKDFIENPETMEANKELFNID